jgi:hypothetical protein
MMNSEITRIKCPKEPARSSWHRSMTASACTLWMALMTPAVGQTINVPATTTLAGKIDLGLLAPNAQVRVTASGSIELYAPNYYQAFADGSLAAPLTSGVITWTAENGPYPTFAGGDGINRYRGGGTNWTGSLWTELGARSTDTLNPNTIRFGTLVGTFKSSPAAADWFVLGQDTVVTAPPTGARLYAAVLDCGAGCYADNRGSYRVTIGARVHSLRDDFNATRNPSGPWSYGFRLATDTPGAFTRFTRSFFPTLVSLGGWDGFSQYGDVLPATNKNFSSINTVTDGATVCQPGEVLGHPGLTRDYVARFIAPVSGLFTLSGSFRGMSVAGTTSTVLIHHETTLLFQADVIGYQTVVNMPAQQVFLTVGDAIDLAVTKGVDYNSDSTGLNLLIEEPCIGITVEPEPRSTCPSGAASFSVTAAGVGPITYQWRKNSIAIDTIANPSAAAATLTLTNLGPADAANYDCIVTNACGSITSNAATLSVCAGDINCDESVDFGDFLAFFNCYDAEQSCADIDGNPGTDFGDFLAFFNAYDAGC